MFRWLRRRKLKKKFINKFGHEFKVKDAYVDVEDLDLDLLEKLWYNYIKHGILSFNEEYDPYYDYDLEMDQIEEQEKDIIQPND